MRDRVESFVFRPTLKNFRSSLLGRVSGRDIIEYVGIWFTSSEFRGVGKCNSMDGSNTAL